MNNNDTIFALSSGHGKSGVAVIRIAGDDLGCVFSQFIQKSDFKCRHAYFCNLCDDEGDLIDQCLAVYFQAPYSFTGTDVIELHTHGAPATINAVFEYLAMLGMRMAMPGEFSRRAFYNNKMDLADVDGLAALLDAQTDFQRKNALQSMMGRDSDVYNKWREQMVDVAAYAAAILDYSPDDLPANIGDKLKKRTKKLYQEIQSAMDGYRAARAIHGGINVVLAGDTNVGKSSIFNWIVGTNRAIVSDVPGTTRDVVSVNLDVDGFLVNLADTAGVRETDDKIESIGIERTKNEIENADIVIHVCAPDSGVQGDFSDNEIRVINKSDTIKKYESKSAIYTSVKTGDGMQELMKELKKKIHEIMDGAEDRLAINARTKSLIQTACAELCDALGADENWDIFAEHVRRAADAIGKILGKITTAEVLDKTFGQLCLGK
ncbi:MAG: tRNA uridine-5-carboxymethylaminomethyl(34) synthesis GTPase MnmE [Alphaproteobacteria bacterium]|nr:tRNA uridine-5-carboxymethylaminomethyl(34) synthesis GTPase MnmE [Alphaproteobacteria bacterium]